MGFLMPKAPAAPPPPPPPPPPAPVEPQKPVYLQEDKLKKQLTDPRRVGRMQTIRTGPRGVTGEETLGKSLLRGGNAKTSNR